MKTSVLVALSVLSLMAIASPVTAQQETHTINGVLTVYGKGHGATRTIAGERNNYVSIPHGIRVAFHPVPFLRLPTGSTFYTQG